mmetsp:Transcript_123232/g.299329  ORF Transcript_123232/g.299329 Transcript_123232/m.299329 type:complete len:339 (-) Transcript_123232:586-1602(-)
MVPVLVDEGPLVDLAPGEAAVAGHVGVGLVRLEAEVGPNIAGAHDDANGVLCGVEGGIVVEVGDAMQMEPATILVAIHLLPHGVHLRGLQVRPHAPFVERDHGAHDALCLRLALGRPALVYLRALGVGLLQLVRLLRRLRLLPGPLRTLGVPEVRQVHALEAQHLVKLAVPGAAARVVLQRKRVAHTLLVGDVQVPHAVHTVRGPVVHVQHHSALRGVQDRVGLLVYLLRQPCCLEGQAAVGADHQGHGLARGVLELGHKEEAVGDQELVALGHEGHDRPPSVVRVGELHVLGPHGQLGLVARALGEVREVDAVLLLVGRVSPAELHHVGGDQREGPS